jgi:hypothetical protein
VTNSLLSPLRCLPSTVPIGSMGFQGKDCSVCKTQAQLHPFPHQLYFLFPHIIYVTFGCRDRPSTSAQPAPRSTAGSPHFATTFLQLLSWSARGVGAASRAHAVFSATKRTRPLDAAGRPLHHRQQQQQLCHQLQLHLLPVRVRLFQSISLLSLSSPTVSLDNLNQLSHPTASALNDPSNQSPAAASGSFLSPATLDAVCSDEQVTIHLNVSSNC